MYEMYLIFFSLSNTMCPGKKIWEFARFTSDCTTSHRRSLSGTVSDKKDDIVDSCSQMVLRLQDVYDPEKVGTSIPFPMV